MINTNEILDTIHMIDQQHLDVRTITMGISLLDCADPDPKAACQKIYDKITRRAEHLVATGVVEAAKRLRAEGYTWARIAEMLDMPVRTVRSYVDGSRRSQSIADFKVVKRWQKKC